MITTAVTRDDINGNYISTDENTGDVNAFSDIESLISWIASRDPDYVLLRDDHINDHSEVINAIYDFASMSQDEMRIIHARAHSRRNAFRQCAYCVRDFVDREVQNNEGAVFVRPINARMSHDSCGHENSKSARAKCRRERRRDEGTMLADDGNEVVIAE